MTATGTKVGEQIEALALERMLFFGDAVLAIAMTLMAVELRMPETSSGFPEPSVSQVLVAMRPQLLAFSFSFLLIGETWIDHHRICRQIRRADRGLPWWNLMLLFFVVLMPFSTSVLRTRHAYAVVLYAVIYGGLGIAKLGFWSHAVRNRLVRWPLDVEGRSTSFRLWATPVVSLIVVLLASAGVTEAMWGFLALPAVMYGLHRRSLVVRHRLQRP